MVQGPERDGIEQAPKPIKRKPNKNGARQNRLPIRPNRMDTDLGARKAHTTNCNQPLAHRYTLWPFHHELLPECCVTGSSAGTNALGAKSSPTAGHLTFPCDTTRHAPPKTPECTTKKTSESPVA